MEPNLSIVVSHEATMPVKIPLTQAQNEFDAVVARAEAGEDIVLTRNGVPIAKLTAVTKTPVEYGRFKGCYVADDLSLPDDVIESFYPR